MCATNQGSQSNTINRTVGPIELRTGRGGVQCRLGGAAVEVEFDHRVRPLLCLETTGIGVELGAGCLATTGTCEIAEHHGVADIAQLNDMQEVGGRLREVTPVAAIECAC